MPGMTNEGKKFYWRLSEVPLAVSFFTCVGGSLHVLLCMCVCIPKGQTACLHVCDYIHVCLCRSGRYVGTHAHVCRRKDSMSSRVCMCVHADVEGVN